MKVAKRVSQLILTLTILLILTSCIVVVDRGYYYENGQYYKSGNFDFNSYQIDEIDISWPYGSVVINTNSDSNYGYIRENSTSSLESEKLHYLLDGRKLYIKYCASGYPLASYSERKTLYLTLPSTLLSNVKITTTYASVLATASNFDSLNIKSNSGYISLNNIILKNNLLVSTQSGQIDLKNSTVISKTLLNTASGKITIDDLKGQNLEIESSSGSIGLSNLGLYSNLQINSSSSSIEINNSFFNSGIIDTKSGSSKLISSLFKSFDYKADSASLTLDGIPSFKLYFNTMSGKLYSPSSIYSDGRGEYIYPAGSYPTTTIGVKTKSGSIYFKP